MPLNETQRLFSGAMLAPVADPAPELAALFTASPSILPERLQIYRNNVVGNLTDALLATYPLVKTLTGEEFASLLMRSYLLENPPREACLGLYGGLLPDFIEKFPPAAGLPYLVDVVRLEWAMNEAYNAADDEPLAPATLQAVPADALADLNLRLRASARLMSSRWPLESIRAFCLNYDEKTSGSLTLEGEGSRLLVCRPGLAVEITALAPDEYLFLETLTAGATLGAALGKTFGEFPAFDFAAVLQRHLKHKTFAALTPERT
jgi:hypothetical protein